MKHVGLFEGIGGFSLAARWAGWETVAWCEINPFGQRVLKHHFPKAKGHGDITKTDFTIYRGQCDVLTGGFPCQPYSLAGKRLGKEDERHLWPEMLRAIREIQPRWVVGENVLGLVNWSGGLVFHEVQSDLEAEGYEILPFLLPACAVNAPHRRDRVWFVAYSDRDGVSRQPTNNRTSDKIRQRRPGVKAFGHDGSIRGWDSFPIESPVCGRNDGISSKLAGITISKHRNESIKAYGNAIVPQVALQIFQAINEYEKALSLAQ